MCSCSLSTVPLHACRALAVLLGLYSLAVIVAEATITPALPNMSVFSQALRRVAHNTIACEMLCFLFLIYPCCAAYFAIYKLGRWSFYLLVPRCTAAAGGSGLVSVALMTIVLKQATAGGPTRSSQLFLWLSKNPLVVGALSTCTQVSVNSTQLVLKCCVDAAGGYCCVPVTSCLSAKGGHGSCYLWMFRSSAAAAGHCGCV